MKIEIKTATYNPRRYGKPWVARVDFSRNPNGDFEWGTWVGDPGADGILIIEAVPGDILARGQKDHRGNNTEVIYDLVRDDGSLLKLTGKASAYKHSMEKK